MPPVKLERTSTSTSLSNLISSNSDKSTDLLIRCSDGMVRTHQAILSMSSGFIRRMFNAQLILTDGGNKRKEEITLFLRDYQKEIIKSLIEFLSTGELRQLKVTKNFIDDLEQLWEDLKIDTISFKDAYDAGKTFLPLGTDGKRKLPPGPRNEQVINKTGLRASPKPLRRIPPTFKIGNSSLLANPYPPKFSSTPRQAQPNPKRATIRPNPLPTVAESLAGKTGVSVTEKPNVEQSIIEDTADADDIMVVGEVKKKESYSFPIKHELPAGISITKQVSKEKKTPDEAHNKASQTITATCLFMYNSCSNLPSPSGFTCDLVLALLPP